METIRVKDLSELSTAARCIVDYFSRHRVVAFRGGMGAGKTTLIREIARLMDVSDDVTSPTFALVNQYVTGAGEIINHFDFYRIARLEEAFDLGYEEYFYSGEICLIEWPERVESLLPEGTLNIRIEVSNDDTRIITIGD